MTDFVTQLNGTTETNYKTNITNILQKTLQNIYEVANKVTMLINTGIDARCFNDTENLNLSGKDTAGNHAIMGLMANYQNFEKEIVQFGKFIFDKFEVDIESDEQIGSKLKESMIFSLKDTQQKNISNQANVNIEGLFKTLLDIFDITRIEVHDASQRMTDTPDSWIKITYKDGKDNLDYLNSDINKGDMEQVADHPEININNEQVTDTKLSKYDMTENNKIQEFGEQKDENVDVGSIAKESDTKDDVCQVHPNGKLKFKGKIVNGEYHGQGILNHYNGKLLFKGNFINGAPDGEECIIYHYSGNLKYRGSIKNGIYEGLGTLYHDNGFAKYTGNFVDDKANGHKCEIYYDDGHLEYLGSVSRGIFHGYGQTYHKNGNQEYEGYFNNGGIEGEECLIYHQNGKIKYNGKMLFGKYEGFGTLWNRNGIVEFKGYFMNGKFIEEYKAHIHGVITKDDYDRYQSQEAIEDQANGKNYENDDLQLNPTSHFPVIRFKPYSDKIDGQPSRYDSYSRQTEIKNKIAEIEKAEMEKLNKKKEESLANKNTVERKKDGQRTRTFSINKILENSQSDRIQISKLYKTTNALNNKVDGIPKLRSKSQVHIGYKKTTNPPYNKATIPPKKTPVASAKNINNKHRTQSNNALSNYNSDDKGVLSNLVIQERKTVLQNDFSNKSIQRNLAEDKLFFENSNESSFLGKSKETDFYQTQKELEVQPKKHTPRFDTEKLNDVSIANDVSIVFKRGPNETDQFNPSLKPIANSYHLNEFMKEKESLYNNEYPDKKQMNNAKQPTQTKAPIAPTKAVVEKPLKPQPVPEKSAKVPIGKPQATKATGKAVQNKSPYDKAVQTKLSDVSFEGKDTNGNKPVNKTKGNKSEVGINKPLTAIKPDNDDIRNSKADLNEFPQRQQSIPTTQKTGPAKPELKLKLESASKNKSVPRKPARTRKVVYPINNPKTNRTTNSKQEPVVQQQTSGVDLKSHQNGMKNNHSKIHNEGDQLIQDYNNRIDEQCHIPGKHTVIESGIHVEQTYNTHDSDNENTTYPVNHIYKSQMGINLNAKNKSKRRMLDVDNDEF